MRRTPVQDSFLQAFVHLDNFDGRSTFSTWLTRIAINSALMILRRRRNARFVSLDGAGDPEGTETYPEVPDRAGLIRSGATSNAKERKSFRMQSQRCGHPFGA